MTAPLRIATRGSALALWQAHFVRNRIAEAGRDAVLVEVSTIGDRDKSTALAQLGESSFGGTGESTQGVFTKEVQRVVLDDHADLAVHSLKDLPTDPTPGLLLAAVPERGDIDDALCLPRDSPLQTLADLPAGSRIGTGSPRRQAMLLAARPDLDCRPIRGNVPTRLAQLDAGDYDAVVLACAGLRRLHLTDRITERLHGDVMWPAVSQAALGLECRAGDDLTIAVLDGLTHTPSLLCVTAERTLLNTLRAGCGAAVGVRSRVDGDQLHLAACILSLDGRQRLTADHAGPADDPVAIGRDLGHQLLADGAADLII